MMQNARKLEALPALGAVATSAGLCYISTGLGSFWPAAWHAPIPILILAFRSSKRAVIVGTVAAYFLGSLNLFTYLARVMPAPLLLLLLLGEAVAFAAVVRAAQYAAPRLPPWAAAFVFPAAWTTYEFLLSLVSPHGTALALAYTQTDLLPLLQIASITGIWGITFIVALVPSAFALAGTKSLPSGVLQQLGPVGPTSLAQIALR
jgi:apolipoprotein N-acyltransferase